MTSNVAAASASTLHLFRPSLACCRSKPLFWWGDNHAICDFLASTKLHCCIILLHNMLQSDSISITSGTLWCVELHCLWTWKSLHCATLRFSRSSLSRSCSLQNASFHQKSPHPAKCIAQSSNILCHRRTNPVDPEVATCFLTNQVSYLHGASSASRKAPHSHEAVEKYYHPVSEQCSAGSPDFSAHRQHLAIDYGFTD